MIGAALNTLLTGIVEIYPLRASQGKELPLATYQVINNQPTNHIHDRAGNRKVTVQIDVKGTEYDEIQGLAFEIIDTLDRYQGTVQGETIKDIRHTGGPDDLFQEEADLYGVTLDFDFWVTQ